MKYLKNQICFMVYRYVYQNYKSYNGFAKVCRIMNWLPLSYCSMGT